MSDNKIIDGFAIAAALRSELKREVEILIRDHGIVPTLNVLLVGDNPASEIYVKNKQKKAQEIGINSSTTLLSAKISEAELIDRITKLNEDKMVNGILIQLPLPSHISSEKIINLIDSKKDVDGFNLLNVGELSVSKDATLKPCTPSGCLYLIKSALGDDLSGLNAVVIGRSNIVGKPMMQLLLHENCTVTVVHSKTKNITEFTKQADILVVAIGKPNFVTSALVKPGATVIDVGINRVNGKITGDVDFEDVCKIANHVTPVPKGVGPMTIAFLLKNTMLAACLQNEIPNLKI